MNDKYKTFEELKEELGDKYDRFMYDMNIQLHSNWNSLREDLKRYDLTYLHETGEHQLADAIEDILDKMNELEGKDKDEIN